MADDLTLTPNPDDPQLQGGGIPISDVPQSEFDPIQVTGIETIQGPALQEREAAQAQVAREQMTGLGIEEAPPEPPAGIDRFLFNEIVPPRAEMLPEVHDLRPPTEQEARKAMNAITPAASEEEVARSQATVARYLENKRDDDRAEQIEWAQQYYTDEHKRKQLAQHPDMKRGVELSPDPELFQATSINNAWLNANAGRKLSAPELDVARKTVGKQLFNIPEISQQQFFTKMQEWSKGQAAERDVALKLDAAVGAHVLQDQLTRTYTPDFSVLEKLKKENPDVFTPENERRFTLMNQRMHGRMRQLGDQVLEPYSQILTLVQKATKGEAKDEDWQAVVDSLRAIDPEDRKTMWGMVGRAGRSGIIDPTGLAQFMENMSKGWAREFNLSDRIERDRETQIDDMRRQMDAGAKFGTKDGRLVYAPAGQPLTPGATELTPEGYGDYREKLNRAFDTIALVREAQEAYETIVDPIRPIFKEGLLSAGERGLYSLPAMGKLMIGGVVPGFGPILTFDAIQADIYRRTRLENPDMPVPEAARMATVSSALQTIPEQLQIKIPLGTFGRLLDVERDITQRGFWAAARTATKREFKALAAENILEGFQDAVDMFYPAIQSQFDPNMKRQDVGEVAWQWLNTRPEVFAAVLVPASIGTGVLTYHDVKNPMRSVFNSDVLRGLGIREDGIQRILGQGSFEAMQSALNVEMAAVTPEDRARGHDYISATAAATAAKQTGVASPSYRVVTQNDGTKVYEVLDPEGKVVYSNTDEDLAQAAYTDTVTAFTTERLAAETAAQATEEGVVADAETEAQVRLLPAESRTSAANVLDFQRNERPTPEQSAALGRLAAALTKDPRGGPTDFVIQVPLVDGATGPGRAAYNFLQGWEQYTGKQVVFVASGSGQPLSFTGVVNPADPNTIFLDAAGDRNVLALLGHEWAHTLALTNPQLHRAMTDAMRPLVVDWLEQEGILKEGEGYGEGQVTEELVSNIVGDAFTRPAFWSEFHRRNPSLFERVVRAIEEWFASIAAAARGSEWGTEGFITNLEEMHGIISSAIEQARQAGPEATVPRGTQEALSFASRREGLSGKERERLLQLGRNGILGERDPVTGGETAIGQIGRGFTSASGHEGAPARGSDFPDAVKARDRETHQGIERARGAIQRENPGISGSPNQQGRDLIDYLAGKQEPPKASEIAKAIAFLKERIPVVSSRRIFDLLKQIDEGRTSRAFLSARNASVYKLVGVSDDGKVSGYLPEDVRFDRKLGAITIRGTDVFSVVDLFKAIALSNQEGSPVFTEIAAVTRDGDIVLKQPYIQGLIETTNPWEAIKQLGLHLAGDIEGTHARGRIGDTEVLFGDLHKGNIMTDLKGNSYLIDALATRALSKQESGIIDRVKGKLPAKEEPAAEPGELFQSFQDATGSEINKPEAEGDVNLATRRGKFAQAKVEGVSKEESVAAAFEKLHGQPEKRLQLFQKIKGAFEQMRERHRAAEARLVAEAPPAQDATAEIGQLEARETKDLEDLDVAEQDALDRSSQEIADRYGDRILAEQDLVKRRALERESKAVAAAQRKGIEAKFGEQRKAMEADYRRQQQAVRVRVEQANLAATREGAAQLAEQQRLHTFAELNAILKALPPEIRGRIAPVLSLPQVRATEAGLTDFLTKAISKIDVAIEVALKREYTTRITQLLERSEPKKTPAGVLKSALGPEAQRATSIARKAVKMDNDETSTRLATIEAALQSPEITEEEQANLIEEWTILNSFGDLDNRNAESLATAFQWLGELVVSGRSAWREKEAERAARMKAIRDEIIGGLGRGTRGGLSQKEIEQGGLAMLSSYGLSHSNFLQFLARILPAESTFLKSWMDRVRRSDNASQDAALAAGDRLMAHMRSSLGINSRGAFANLMWRLKEIQKGAVEAYDGRVIGPDGNVISPGTLEKLDMSRLEAIQFLLAWAQPDVQAKMIAQGWTPDSIAAMEKMTATSESQAVLAFLRQEFAASYAISNPIYQALFGMNMPQVRNYAPTRFRATKDSGDIAPFGGPLAASGLTPSYAKSRVNHSAMMDQVDALNVFWQHIAQQAHWTNFAELTREMRSVFGNRDVRAAIEQKHGKMTLQQADQWIDTIANAGGNKSADIIVNARILDALISGKAMSTLGFSLRTIFAQVDSMMRAVFAMPMGRIAKAILDPKFLSNIPKAWRSETIQRRVKNGGSPEARYLFEQTRLKPSIMLRMGRAAMMPIQLTDAGLTSLSSAVVFTDSYNQALKAGRTEAEATAIASDDMDDAVYRYSQPTGIGSRSLQELTGGQWKKAFMLFMSDARLKSAIYFEAGTNIVKGKGTALDWQRVIFVHVMAGISQLVLNAYRDTFTDDDDDEIWTAESLWKAVMLGPLQGLVLLGTAADAVASKMLGGQYFAPSRDPFLDAIANGGRALQNLDKAWQWEDRQALIKEWNAIARAIAVHPVLAAPAVFINFLKPIFGLWENLEENEE